MAIVSITSQQVHFYDSEADLRAPVSNRHHGREDRRPGVFALLEKGQTTIRACMTMPGCRTCSASPEPASRSWRPLPCYAAAHAACEFPTALRKTVLTVRHDADRDCGIISRYIDAAPVDLTHPTLFVPNA